MWVGVIALGLIAAAFGYGLAYASKKFTVELHPKVDEVLKVLPHANCGACGLAGCKAFAEAVVAGKVPVDGCVPGQKKVANKIGEILGKKVEAKEAKKAQLYCNGNKQNCPDKFDYEGIESCKAAVLIGCGQKGCDYGCLGFGDCVKVCPFDAIAMGKDGLPKIDKEKCTGCAKCVKNCPKGILHLAPEKSKVHVRCSSKDPAIIVTKACKVGCIACKQCEKACPVDAIHVIDNLAVIDYSKCVSCGKCVTVCPRKIIEKVEVKV
ncbi:Fe-S cluster domain-containing protein [Candidatus Woesearchaeota archaeon]|nr:Fe-S cluster domain-containing protein [Candidatus Woesearchaeota archaeon]